MNRRSFLNGAMALVGAAVAPPAQAALPRIAGDGVHDDWAGIQAIVNGEPPEAYQSSFIAKSWLLRGDRLFVPRTIAIPSGARIAFVNNRPSRHRGVVPLIQYEDNVIFGGNCFNEAQP